MGGVGKFGKGQSSYNPGKVGMNYNPGKVESSDNPRKVESADNPGKVESSDIPGKVGGWEGFEWGGARSRNLSKDFTTMCQMSKCSWIHER